MNRDHGIILCCMCNEFLILCSMRISINIILLAFILLTFNVTRNLDYLYLIQYTQERRMKNLTELQLTTAGDKATVVTQVRESAEREKQNWNLYIFKCLAFLLLFNR